MLQEIRISALGVIDAAEAEFSDGLTVLTGETGAGKTMVVTSLHLLAGARADAARVRAGAAKAVVEGRFSASASADEVLDGAGAERDEDGSVIATRTVAEGGRSRAYLGGRSVPVGTLGAFTGPILTVHGQNDQLRLMRPERQRELLDVFGGATTTAALTAYQQVRRDWVAATKELRDRTTRSRELAIEHDQLTGALTEIDSAAPAPGEDVELAQAIKRLSDVDSLRAAADVAYTALTGASYAADGDDDGASVLTGLAAARTALESADDAPLRDLAAGVDDAVHAATEVARELGGYLADLPTDHNALENNLSRQGQLRALTRKYAADIDGVLAWADAARARLASIDLTADGLKALTDRVAMLTQDLSVAAVKLTRARRAAAKRLAERVTEELASLAMGSAALAVSVEPAAVGESDPVAITIAGAAVRAGEFGTDVVELLLASHTDAPALPLAKSASGGELSRVMLALEVVLASTESGLTMVFDEVDAGVGGAAAVEIGRRLAALARHHQVIVVTHLPQVAAFADTHLLIGKRETKGSVTSTVTALAPKDRVPELARMLAGMGDTATGRAHAEELLAAAQSDKAQSDKATKPKPARRRR